MQLSQAGVVDDDDDAEYITNQKDVWVDWLLILTALFESLPILDLKGVNRIDK